MVGVKVRIHEVAHGYAKAILRKPLDCQRFFGENERIDEDCALSRDDDTSRNLCVKITGEHKNVVCNPFSLHR